MVLTRDRVRQFIRFVMGEIWALRIFAFLLCLRRFAYARTSGKLLSVRIRNRRRVEYKGD